MRTSVIYLQSGFWKQLQADTSISGLQCLMNVFEAILNADLHTDIEDEVWDTDPFLSFLWKKYLENQYEIELFDNISIDKPEENIENLSAIYLMDCDTQTCNNLGSDYGIIAINNSGLSEKEYLFKGNAFLLEKNSKRYVDGYLHFKSKIYYPCNSMILVDPYLLTNKQNIKNNLITLLNAMLPLRKQHIIFHISIFSMLGNRNNDALNVKEYHSEISEMIQTIRDKLEFSLTLYAIGSAEEFHSRMILTNNVFFSAYDGFDIFKDNGQASKNASFDIVVPRLMGNNRQDMNNYLRWIKITRDRSHNQYEKHFWGTRENRLFELVKDSKNGSK